MKKPNGIYSDDPVITGLAVFIVAAWVTIIYVAVKWALEVAR